MYEPPQDKAGLDKSESHVGLLGIINQAKTYLDSLGDDYSDGWSELESLHTRLVSGQFRLAVLGQFKRGRVHC